MERDEVKNYAMTEKDIELARELNAYIRSGDISKSRTFIEKLSPDTRHRIATPNELTFVEPALVAAIDGAGVEFVQLLMNECRVSIVEKVWTHDTIYQQTGTGRTYSGNYKSMTPLDIAIRRNKPDIVAYLLSIGADVHGLKIDKYMYTACLTGSINTIKILCEYGGDVNSYDGSGYTLLMQFVKKFDVCRLLVDNGADIHRINKNGETAVQMAAKLNLPSQVRLFVERGAQTARGDEFGRDLLQLASWYGAVETVDFLKETVFKDVSRHVEAFQVLGARFGSYGEVTKALSMWRKAIQLSSESGILTHATTVRTPLGIAVEATTLAELDDIDQVIDQIYNQCIVMIYKHFGNAHPLFLCVINLIMGRYFKIGSFNRWLKFVTYCFEMTVKCQFNLERFFDCVRDIYDGVGYYMDNIFERTVEPTLDFDLVYELMTSVVNEATKCTQIEKMADLLSLIANTISMFAYVKCDKNQMISFRRLVQSVVKPGLRDSKGTTLLLCVFKRCGWRYLKYGSPHLDITAMLLECGADINEIDNDGNNALHLIMEPYKSDILFLENFKHTKPFAEKFVKNGIHLDARNRYGLTVISFLHELGFNIAPPINLMCSAARVIRRLSIDVNGILPTFLAEFVKMH